MMIMMMMMKESRDREMVGTCRKKMETRITNASGGRSKENATFFIVLHAMLPSSRVVCFIGWFYGNRRVNECNSYLGYTWSVQRRSHMIVNGVVTCILRYTLPWTIILLLRSTLAKTK
mmetsp:Transcript_14674/g.30927  ORF Transcript_14674/g.30927 Transcript_14674/m.30927 type:complete len:118 (+) Transcript_14674:639-992(+)